MQKYGKRENVQIFPLNLPFEKRVFKQKNPFLFLFAFRGVMQKNNTFQSGIFITHQKKNKKKIDMNRYRDFDEK